MPARKLRVALSRDTVEAEIVDGRIWRIAVHSPRLRTADSLGVGTTLARLLQLRNPRGMTGEGRFYVASPAHCGMSFRLANAGPGAQRGDLDSAGLARLPKSAVVSEVLVFGCRRLYQSFPYVKDSATYRPTIERITFLDDPRNPARRPLDTSDGKRCRSRSADRLRTRVRVKRKQARPWCSATVG